MRVHERRFPGGRQRVSRCELHGLGHAGCVRVNGIRIAGASGIYKPQDFRQGNVLRMIRILINVLKHMLGHWEKIPYDKSSMRSIYHIREYNIRRLSLVRIFSFF